MVRSKFLMYFIYLGIGVAIASIGLFFFRNTKDTVTLKAKAIVIEKTADTGAEKKLLVFKINDSTLIRTTDSELYPGLQQGDSVNLQYREILNNNQTVSSFKVITAEKINR